MEKKTLSFLERIKSG